MQETQEAQALGGEDPLEKEMATHCLFLPGTSHGERSLEGPWGLKESDRTEQLRLPTPFYLKDGSLTK